MSGRLVVALGLVALVGVGGLLLYLVKTSESVPTYADAGAGGPGPEPAGGSGSGAIPARLADASAKANSIDAAPGARPGAVEDGPTTGDAPSRRRVVPDRRVKLGATATGAR